MCPAAAVLLHKANTRGKTIHIEVAEIHDLIYYYVVYFIIVYGRCILFTPHYYFGKVDTNTRIIIYYYCMFVYYIL